jgi:hypothetical protein
MFSPWTLIFGSLPTFFMCLCTFILQPDVHTCFARLLGSSWFAMVHEFMAYRKAQIAIAALTIRQETPIMGLACDLVQGRDRLVKKCALFLATISLPHEPTGSIHEQDCPPR